MDTVYDHIADSYEQLLGVSEEDFKEYLQAEYGYSEEALSSVDELEHAKSLYWNEYMETVETAHGALHRGRGQVKQINIRRNRKLR
jgi:hypothetical protein